MTHPLLLEINTRCWLRSLSEAAGCAVTLANVPDAEFQRWRELGLTHIWLMGVWPTGPRSRAFCLAEPDLRARFHELLPASGSEDLAGSPYAIEKYEVPAALGGEEGLKILRDRLNGQGIKLILDFVANHAGLDHAWISEWPDRFVHSTVERPGTFLEATAAGPRWFAHGRDPYFPPWRDTVQFDYRCPETRAVMRSELEIVARQCDGVRCDLAMLQLNDVFAKTWAGFSAGGLKPMAEFWFTAIKNLRSRQSGFLFLAEAYWGLEPCLQSLGFDYTYDKRVYDFLVERRTADLRKHLFESTPGFLSASAHFLENHDELRAAALLSPAEHRAAALLTLGLPGMRMLYEGQLDGRHLRVPVQFARWPDEPPDAQVQSMYQQLFAALENSAVGRGEWKMLRTDDGPANAGGDGMVIVQWQDSPGRFDLVVVNLAPTPGRCRVRPEVGELSSRAWLIHDALAGEDFPAGSREFQGTELLLDLPPHAAQLLRFSTKT
jgi:Alpha amylase, catalytic domain